MLTAAIFPAAFILLRFMRVSGRDPRFASDSEIVWFLAIVALIVVAMYGTLFALAGLMKLLQLAIQRSRR